MCIFQTWRVILENGRAASVHNSGLNGGEEGRENGFLNFDKGECLGYLHFGNAGILFFFLLLLLLSRKHFYEYFSYFRSSFLFARNETRQPFVQPIFFVEVYICVYMYIHVHALVSPSSSSMCLRFINAIHAYV